MGTTARIRHTESKVDVKVETAANLAATVTDSSLAIWVGSTASILNQPELRGTLERCFSRLKDRIRFDKPTASNYAIAHAKVGASDEAITVVQSQAGTWAEEGQVAVVYGPDFDHMPGASHFTDRRLRDLVEVMQERAWAPAA